MSWLKFMRNAAKFSDKMLNASSVEVSLASTSYSAWSDIEYPARKSSNVKCPYCKQWGEPRKQCEHCGAPIDIEEPPAPPVRYWSAT
jgi:methionyl-tRNA synthetase